jgi:hypothetical protein
MKEKDAEEYNSEIKEAGFTYSLLSWMIQQYKEQIKMEKPSILLMIRKPV